MKRLKTSVANILGVLCLLMCNADGKQSHASPPPSPKASADPWLVSGRDYALENGKLAFELTAPDQFRLKNKLTGKTYAGNANSFEVLIDSGGQVVRLSGADFARRNLSRPAPDSLKNQL